MIYPIFSEPIYKNKIDFLNKKIIDADFKFKKNESNLISAVSYYTYLILGIYGDTFKF